MVFDEITPLKVAIIIQAVGTGWVDIYNKWEDNIIVNGTLCNETIAVNVNDGDLIIIEESNNHTFRHWKFDQHPLFHGDNNIKGRVLHIPSIRFFTTDSTGATASENMFAFFNYNGDIIELPEGSMDTHLLTGVQDANYLFHAFNWGGSLVALPEKSFDFFYITGATGTNFCASFNQVGHLTNLPDNSFHLTNFVGMQGPAFMAGFNLGGDIIVVPVNSFNTNNMASGQDVAFFYQFNYQGKIPTGGTNIHNRSSGDIIAFYADVSGGTIVHPGDMMSYANTNDGYPTLKKTILLRMIGSGKVTIANQWYGDNLAWDPWGGPDTVQAPILVDNVQVNSLASITLDVVHNQIIRIDEAKPNISFRYWRMISRKDWFDRKPLIASDNVKARMIHLPDISTFSAGSKGTTLNVISWGFFACFNFQGCLINFPELNTEKITTTEQYINIDSSVAKLFCGLHSAFACFNTYGAINEMSSLSFMNIENKELMQVESFGAQFNAAGALDHLPPDTLNTPPKAITKTAGDYFTDGFAPLEFFNITGNLKRGSTPLKAFGDYHREPHVKFNFIDCPRSIDDISPGEYVYYSSGEEDKILIILRPNTDDVVCDITVNNQWTTPIIVNGISVTDTYTFTSKAIPVSGFVLRIVESQPGVTFRTWRADENGLVITSVVAVNADLWSMPLLNHFTTDSSGTTAPDNFFYGFNCNGRIKTTYVGQFDTSGLTGPQGKNFFRAFNKNGVLRDLPSGSMVLDNLSGDHGTNFLFEFNLDGFISSGDLPIINKSSSDVIAYYYNQDSETIIPGESMHYARSD
jgi:hypothetical protein